jgi:hypothetical protein
VEPPELLAGSSSLLTVTGKNFGTYMSKQYLGRVILYNDMGKEVVSMLVVCCVCMCVCERERGCSMYMSNEYLGRVILYNDMGKEVVSMLVVCCVCMCVCV